MQTNVEPIRTTGLDLRLGRAPSARRPSWYVEISLVIFAALLFAVSSFSVSSDTLWLHLLKPLTDGVEPIANVTEVKGSARRKTAIDSLWLPLTSSAVVYDGDLISTGEQSLIEISLGPDLQLSVEPSSLLRVRKIAGQPLIQLSRGYLKTHSLTDQTVLIQRGGRVEGVLIRKGTFLIRNDDAIGVQITAFADDVKIAKGVESRRTRAQARSADPTDAEDSNDASKDQTPEPPLPEMEPLALKFALPLPKNETRFLMRGGGGILIAARTKCKETCGLTVERNGKLFLSKMFSKEEPALLRLSSDEIQPGRYEWTFVSGPERVQAVFEVEPYSSEAMNKALKADHPIEIL